MRKKIKNNGNNGKRTNQSEKDDLSLSTLKEHWKYQGSFKKNKTTTFKPGLHL